MLNKDEFFERFPLLEELDWQYYKKRSNDGDEFDALTIAYYKHLVLRSTEENDA